MDTTKFAPIEGLLQTDSYKLDHRRVYGLAGNTTKVYSNWTNRGSRIPGVDKVVHFGLQAFLKDLSETWKPFFEADEDLVVDLYRERLRGFLPDDVDLQHIRDLHRIGYLPLEFKALPEGTRVPVRVPTFTIENTVPEFFWLTNYLETVISASIWQASTSATLAHVMRALLDEGALLSGMTKDDVNFQGHDFSFRGMSSPQSAAFSGAGHLLSFNGTDSLIALDWIDQHYGTDYLAGSVPATEHSVMCTGAAVLGEKELFRRIIDLYPTGIVSVVSDTFDLWKVLTDFLPGFKEEIMSRDGKIVIRPDSGNPVDILCGTRTNPDLVHTREVKTPESDPAYFGVVELLWREFGGTINEAGFKVLDSHVGVIYGDSITYDRAQQINERLMKAGFATTNWVAGMGSYFYQYNTRDTFMSAIKATWAEVDDVGYDLQKDPVTDSGVKKSAKGRLSVQRDSDGELFVIEQATSEQEAASLLETIWKDGKFVKEQTFGEIREILASN